MAAPSAPPLSLMTLREKLFRGAGFWWQRLKNAGHGAWAGISYLLAGRPARGLYLIGVTGTDGKTTTVHLLAEILASIRGRRQVGLLSTTSFWLGERREANETKLTTLPSTLVWRLLRRMKKQGVKYVVIEVSSHALDQHRLFPLRWDGAVWLNLAREHLDYHRTMKKYARAKARLWRRVKKQGWLVGNLDSRWARSFWEGLSGARRCAFAFKDKNAAVRGRILQEAPALVMEAAIKGGAQLKLRTCLLGSWQAENILAAIAAAVCMRLPLDKVKQAIESFKGVPGRWEVVSLPTAPFAVVIDYAVTPHAFRALYRTVRVWRKCRGWKGRIIHIFGAAGERDRGKRPLLGAIAARNADLIVLTDEDPFGENPDRILSDIAQGIRGAKERRARWRVIRSRRKAISWALQRARAGDLVLLTGKGAETSIAYGRRRAPWKEREEVLRAWQVLRGRKQE